MTIVKYNISEYDLPLLVLSIRETVQGVIDATESRSTKGKCEANDSYPEYGQEIRLRRSTWYVQNSLNNRSVTEE